MVVTIDSQDIAQVGRARADNPITQAILRATGERWEVVDDKLVQDAGDRYRVIPLPRPAVAYWDILRRDFTGALPGIQFEMELETVPWLPSRRRRDRRRSATPHNFQVPALDDRRDSDRRRGGKLPDTRELAN